jgi:hypothetical protein
MESTRKIIIFPLTETKQFFFLSPNSFKKWKLLGDKFFLSPRPNFSSSLAENFCKELATLKKSQAVQVGNFLWNLSYFYSIETHNLFLSLLLSCLAFFCSKHYLSSSQNRINLTRKVSITFSFFIRLLHILASVSWSHSLLHVVLLVDPSCLWPVFCFNFLWLLRIVFSLSNSCLFIASLEYCQVFFIVHLEC